MLKRPFLSFAGIFLVSSAALTFQIGLTRIFSISQWYHLAFMIISLALLGFGTSGTLLCIFPSWAKGKFRFTVLACLFSLTSLLSFMVANRIPFDSFRMGIERLQILYLAIIYLSLSLPFIVAGLLIGGALVQFAEKANIIYSYNLFGSGVGCFLVLSIPMLGGAEKIPVLVACLGLAAAFLFSGAERRVLPFIFSCLTTCMIVVFVVWGRAWLEIPLSPYKGVSLALKAGNSRVISRRENTVSRVDIIESPVVKYAPGLSHSFDGILPPQFGIGIDGENLTGITIFKDEDELAFTEYLPGAVCYGLIDPRRILIIEPHGGLDVLSALYHGAESMTVVESNPLIVDMIRKDCRQFVEEPYWNHNVKIIKENARAYIRRADQKFDLVTVSLNQDFGAVMSGAFSLSEEHLYTVEAVKGYLNILSADGILLITRWLQTPPSECIRLGATIVSALEEVGFSNPGEQFVFIRGWMTGTFMVKGKGYRGYELDKIRSFCQKKKFDLVWMPGIREDEINLYNSFPQAYHHNAMRQILSKEKRPGFLKEYDYDVSPVRDNRPFFFHFFRWKQTPLVLANLGKRWLPYGGGGYLVITFVLVIAIVSSVLLIIAPLWVRRLGRGGDVRPLRRWMFFAYFVSLGMGFLFLEICFMHYFILFIGQPTYAFSVVLSGMLVFSSGGSFLSGRVKTFKALQAILFCVCITTVLYGVFLQKFFFVFMGETLFNRILFSMGILLPVGTLMGFPFPVGLRLVNKLGPEFLPWVWGINGCASVVASILALSLSLSKGYNWVIMGASFFYFVALIAVKVIGWGEGHSGGSRTSAN